MHIHSNTSFDVLKGNITDNNDDNDGDKPLNLVSQTEFKDDYNNFNVNNGVKNKNIDVDSDADADVDYNHYDGTSNGDSKGDSNSNGISDRSSDSESDVDMDDDSDDDDDDGTNGGVGLSMKVVAPLTIP
mmetsp:Transcript_30071/g.34101  ORF Transcript_30071/g.34101 Transcript_30071/m.34101 type:complete len:130 (-) Transcript_30071:18-407(-)